MIAVPFARTARSAVVALSLALPGALHFPAFAQEASERVGLIMNNLPPQGSKDYKELRRLAGKATGQALNMTKAEVWNVPPERVEELFRAAAAKGVTVTRLDANWNRALAPMKDGAEMTAEQKSMMGQAMDSKAAMGVSMMALPQANVMEYALTKDKDALPKKGEPGPTIVLPLNAATSVTARRVSVKPYEDGCIWRGESVDTGEPVTLMWWPGGRLTGTVTYKGHVYAIKNMGGAMHGVVEMNPDGLPPEHAPAGLDQMKKMRMLEDPLAKKGDASLMMEGAPEAPASRDEVGPGRGDTRNLEDAAGTLRGKRGISPRHYQHLKRAAVGKGRRARVPAPVTIDLLVAYTRAAASRYADIRTDLVALAVEEANQSMANSGIGHVRFRVVKTYETDYAESGSHFDHVFQLLQAKDGVMDDIPRLRDEVKADVAVLIVHDPNGCGLAAKVAAEAEKAFAVVHHECAATTYSLAHEVGHIIGTRHESARDDSTDPFPYGHGFVNGREWRTMMSYKESCDGCPRLPVWSNPAIRIKGVRAGDGKSNNARVIAEQAARVAAFR